MSNSANDFSSVAEPAATDDVSADDQSQTDPEVEKEAISKEVDEVGQ
jgi:hypothetical protein